MFDAVAMDNETSPLTPPSGPVEARSDIVLLTSGGQFSWIIANHLLERFGPITVIEETPECPRLLRRRRRRMLGSMTVLGQRAFDLAQRIAWRMSRARRDEILKTERLDTSRPRSCRFIHVPSVNAPECRDALRSLAPKVVLVVGTRIIRPPTLRCIEAPFINYHAGINPKYRGICGAYWALAIGDRQNFGATLHLVDAGVDTGSVLYTAHAAPTRRDNITTYPFLLAGAARHLAVQAIEGAIDGRLAARTVDLPSYQWFHPTIWQYVWNGLTRGVW